MECVLLSKYNSLNYTRLSTAKALIYLGIFIDPQRVSKFRSVGSRPIVVLHLTSQQCHLS